MMEISYRQLRELSIHLVHDINDDYDEISPFLSALNKIKKEVERSGFKGMFNREEKEMWKKIFEQIKIEEKPQPGPEVKQL